MENKGAYGLMYEMDGKVYGIELAARNGNGLDVSISDKLIQQMGIGLAKVEYFLSSY